MSLPSLLDPPILFAHRGGRAHANENTMAAFELGLRLGATGLESDAWLTADGVVVLDHHGRVRFGMRRRAIARCARAELPDHIPTLADLYATCGSAFHLSLDVKDKAAFDAIVAVARDAASDGLSRLWLCHPNLDTLVSWRDRCASSLRRRPPRQQHASAAPPAGARAPCRGARGGGHRCRQPPPLRLDRRPHHPVPSLRARGLRMGRAARTGAARAAPDGDRRCLQRLGRPHGRRAADPRTALIARGPARERARGT